MQSILESLVIAVIGAIAIIIVLIILGVSIGYSEEIKRRNIHTYARFIITPILLLATTYLYITEQLSSNIFFLTIIWLLPVIFCTDWTRLRRNRMSDNGQQSPNERRE